MRKLEAYAGTPLYSYAIVLCILGFQGRGEGGGGRGWSRHRHWYFIGIASGKLPVVRSSP